MSFSATEAREKIAFFKQGSDAEIRRRFSLPATDARDWKVETAKLDALQNSSDEKFRRALYRPFDMRFTCYTGKSRGLYASPQQRVMKNLLGTDNIAITASSVNRQKSLGYYFITNHITDFHVHDSIGDSTSLFPIYVYPDAQVAQVDAFMSSGRALNLDPKLYAAICKAAGIDPADQAGPDDDFRAATGEARPSEVKLFDYIYGVLHSPAYRETFAEFLKIDFPRIPYPPSPEVFAHISEKGEQLRRLHLMETSAIGETPYPYHGDGDDMVAAGYPKWDAISSSPSGEGEGVGDVPAAPHTDSPHPNPSPEGEGLKRGRVHVNKDQYFADVPAVAWTFHIGGYQPAQKWLKDRRGRTLSWDDIGHYQKIVKILIETDRIMRGIELPLGGD